MGFKDWSPGRCRRWGEWEGQGELGGWEAVVREQNVNFSAVELLQVMRLLRNQTQTPSGAGKLQTNKICLLLAGAVSCFAVLEFVGWGGVEDV